MYVVLENKDACELVRETLNVKNQQPSVSIRSQWLAQRAARNLVDSSLARGSSDNTTAVVVLFNVDDNEIWINSQHEKLKIIFFNKSKKIKTVSQSKNNTIGKKINQRMPHQLYYNTKKQTAHIKTQKNN